MQPYTHPRTRTRAAALTLTFARPLSPSPSRAHSRPRLRALALTLTLARRLSPSCAHSHSHPRTTLMQYVHATPACVPFITPEHFYSKLSFFLFSFFFPVLTIDSDLRASAPTVPPHALARASQQGPLSLDVTTTR
jgi:hypothetical protein